MAVSITSNIQSHIDFFKKMPNITSVEVKPVPPEWKEKINNVESIMFVIHKSNIYMDLVLPLSLVDAPLQPYLLQNLDRFGIVINGLIDKMSYDDCMMCVNNELLESFYYLNTETNSVDEIENVTIKTELSFFEKNLVAYLLTVPFVKEVFLYDIANNSDHVLIACNLVNLTYTGVDECPMGNDYCPPFGTRYKVMVLNDTLGDISSHHTILQNLVTYYNTTVGDAKHGVYDKTLQPILPEYLQNRL